jgi:hypothetical protein
MFMDFENQFAPCTWLFKAEIWNSRLKKMEPRLEEMELRLANP